MKCLVIVAALLAVAFGKPGYLGAPLAYNAALPYAAHFAAVPAVATSVSTQYHAQDALGQYSYGYAGGPSAKAETKTLDGVVRGGYSYIDGHGLVQSAQYVSDPVNGFRVAATNLPVGPSAPAPAIAPAVAVAHAAPVVSTYAAHVPAVHAAVPLETPEVSAARAAHVAAHLEAKAHLLGRKKRSPGFLHGGVPAAVTSYAAAVPAAVNTYAATVPAAVAHAAPAVAVAAPAVAYEPARSFAYSATAVHADPVVAAAPVAVAHAAPAAVAHAAHTVAVGAPAVAVEPARSFAYSATAVHADPVVAAAPVALAHAAPAAVTTYAAAAPAVVAAHAAHAVAAPAAVTTYAAAAPAVVAAHAAPVAVAHAAPAFAVAPVAAAVSGSSQYQAQDTLGQYSYGYANVNSEKHEARDVFGNTHGAYRYVDGHGLVQSVKYHADPVNGFRVAATNLPVGPGAH